MRGSRCIIHKSLQFRLLKCNIRIGTTILPQALYFIPNLFAIYTNKHKLSIMHPTMCKSDRTYFMGILFCIFYRILFQTLFLMHIISNCNSYFFRTLFYCLFFFLFLAENKPYFWHCCVFGGFVVTHTSNLHDKCKSDHKASFL